MFLAAVARIPPRVDLKIKATQITLYLVVGSALVTLVTQVATRIIYRNTPKQSQQKIICNMQHATNHLFFVMGHVLLVIAVFAARIGRIRL